MTVTGRDGNVITADFGDRTTLQSFLPEIVVRCRMLYLDDHVALARITYTINGEEFIQHICKGAGIDA